MKIINKFNPIIIYYFIKKILLIRTFKKVGNNFIYDPKSCFLTPQYIELGDNVFIGDNAYISANLKIGNNVIIGPKLLILGGNHIFAVKGKSVRFLHPKERENVKTIFIEDEVWCGASVIVLDGVKIGMGAVIGAGSIVSKEIPPYVIAVGNPCKIIKMIFDNETLINHIKDLGKSEEYAINIMNYRFQKLKELNIENLPIVDKTKDYWEFNK